MNGDYFNSSTLSLVLSWLFSIPILIGLLGFLINMLFEKQEGMPRVFTIWILLCILLFSPLRYLILQLIVASAYAFQSLGAFVSLFLLAIYIPIVYGILYAIGFGLPLFLTILVAGIREPISKFRIILSSILAPFIFILSSILFYYVLPYAGYSTHWLKAVKSQKVCKKQKGYAAIS